MSSATTLPTLSAPSYSAQHLSPRPQPALHLPSPMSSSEADTALQQQSKRLAGLSITNSTGAKVSILNDSSVDHESSAQLSSPRSPLPHDHISRRSHLSEEHALAQHHRHQYEHYRYRESNFEAGRSSSLTNASTPMYSSQELAASQRSRSLSGSTALSPIISRAGSSASSPTYPYFSRSYSEDNQSDDSESYRGVSDPSAGGAGANGAKRKYSCTFPGCHKVFTTSGHLARHNRIHTGERNFACLMPGCPSKFSRQDNMMQHYRTHISPKSRRGTSKKHETELGSLPNNSQEAIGQYEHNPNAGYYSEHEQQHSHAARQDSGQNSPPRYNEYNGRHPAEHHSNGNNLRHKGHHTPLPHFNVQGQAETQGGQSNLPSPLTPTIAQPPTYHHQQPGYGPSGSHSAASRQPELYVSHSHGLDTSKSPSMRYRSDPALASPTSPMTQDVERMEGIETSPEQERGYTHHGHHQQRPSQHQQYQGQQSSGQYKHHYQYHQQSNNASHAGHAQANQSHGGYQLPPLSVHSHGHGQERRTMERSLSGGHLNTAAPPSPQSTPHTPTKYRFDPIQDCLQQDKHQHQHRDTREHRDQRDMHYESQNRFAAHYYAAAGEDEDMPPTAHSSAVSSASSMTSISSTSSGPHHHPRHPHQSKPTDGEHKQESGEEMSGLDHLAQIASTYGVRA
ncbi:MAG: hypothetical protein J3Q66DRAFT_76078 [Benniella sp.]|nr:MAG: hypothetical protein J3Q66DRAFT_76078 [Benniella sp.]